MTLIINMSKMNTSASSQQRCRLTLALIIYIFIKGLVFQNGPSSYLLVIFSLLQRLNTQKKIQVDCHPRKAGEPDCGHRLCLWEQGSEGETLGVLHCLAWISLPQSSPRVVCSSPAQMIYSLRALRTVNRVVRRVFSDDLDSGL